MSRLGSDRPLTPFWARALALFALALFTSVWVWWPMLQQYPGTATLDGRYFLHQIAISKAAIARYHEAPLWNAFDCRGIPMWDHPENITGSPFFWATLPFTATQTFVVWQLSHLVIAFIGMWLLARDDVKLSRMGTFIAAAMWAFAAAHTTQYAGAHSALISFYDAPLLLFLWRRAEHSWDYAVGCGLMLAWMFFDGATYALPFAIPMLAIETLLRMWPPRRAARVALAGLVVGVVAIVVGAARLLPLLDQFGQHKRQMEPDIDAVSRAMLNDMFTLRSAGYLNRLDGQQYVFGEYLSYIGWLGVILATLGMIVSAIELPWLVIMGVVVFAIMLGHYGESAPWTMLHTKVFPFTALRVPSRFRLLFMVPVSLWVALATDRIPTLVKRVSPRWADAVKIALVGIALLVVGDIVGLDRDLIAPRFTGAPEQPVRPSTRFYYGGAGLTPDAIDQPRQNRANLGCRAGWAYHQRAALWEGDVPQARAVDSDAVVVEVANRTHNTFTIDVEAKRPGRIHLNSAYNEGWQSDVGSVVEDKSLLAIDLPEGHHRLHVKYWPRRLTSGLALSAIGLVLSLGFLFRRRLWRPSAARQKRPSDSHTARKITP